jgi:hypothetical protein
MYVERATQDVFGQVRPNSEVNPSSGGPNHPPQKQMKPFGCRTRSRTRKMLGRSAVDVGAENLSARSVDGGPVTELARARCKPRGEGSMFAKSALKPLEQDVGVLSHQSAVPPGKCREVRVVGFK